MRQLNRSQFGFTLLELAVTITIIALLAMASLPAFASYLANSQLREAANVVLVNAMWASNEAIKLNATTSLQVIGGSIQVTTTDSSSSAVLRTTPLSGNVKTADFVARFDSTGRLAPFGTQLTLALFSSKYACSADIRCPVVRIDAGGSVSVCPTGVCQ